MQENWYCYEEINDREVRLLRVYGDNPELCLPEKIDFKEVTQIGAYCFAKKNALQEYLVACDGQKKSVKDLEEEKQKGHIRELCGDYIQNVNIPDSVIRLGNLAFYQCSRLESLTFGKALSEVGSDAFMNCTRLHKIQLRGSVFDANGLKSVLAQRSSETEVVFFMDGRVETVLVYAEYSEYYDEIGPAHIFELLIDGDGFRARQCFINNHVALAKYDEVFAIARTRESQKTLIKTALMRLYYPVGLGENAREMYETYIREKIAVAGELLVKQKDLPMITFLVEAGYVAQEIMQKMIDYAVSQEWTEGAGTFLRMKSTLVKEEKSVYSFDDF